MTCTQHYTTYCLTLQGGREGGREKEEKGREGGRERREGWSKRGEGVRKGREGGREKENEEDRT